MAPEYLRIKCPACGAILQVQDKTDIESKYATCAVCKTRNLIKDFTKVSVKQEEHTQYPGNEEETSYRATQANPPTDIGESLNVIIGLLRVLPTGPIFQLHLGRQTIGRKTISPPHADFGIHNGSKRISREHLILEVKKVSGRGYVHYVSLAKEKVNASFVGNHKLEYGDCLVLQHGDMIRLPDQDLRFELPDEEGTIY